MASFASVLNDRGYRLKPEALRFDRRVFEKYRRYSSFAEVNLDRLVGESERRLVIDVPAAT